MKYIVDGTEYDFTDMYSYIVNTVSYEDIPSTRSSKESVIGRDGQFTFTDGLNNKQISIEMHLKDSSSLVTRRVNARDIRKVLLQPGKLILPYENSIYYNAQVWKQANIRFNSTYDTLRITFDVEPYAYSVLEDLTDLTWGDADISWGAADFTWGASEGETTFEFTSAGTITITNLGNATAEPIIKITGDNNITIADDNGNSFTYTGLAGVLYIDCQNYIVYDNSAVNKIANFSGDFLQLNEGENTLDVTGTFTDVEIVFENKNRYV